MTLSERPVAGWSLTQFGEESINLKCHPGIV